MIAIESVIATLENLKGEYALAACIRPQGKKSFDYGFASGRVHGLAEAVEAINKMLTEDVEQEILREQDK